VVHAPQREQQHEAEPGPDDEHGADRPAGEHDDQRHAGAPGFEGEQVEDAGEQASGAGKHGG
jgi:hypothetical protein